MFKDSIYIFTGFDFYIVCLLLGQSFGSAIIQIYSANLNVQFRYVEYLVISFVNSIGNVTLSIFLILLVFPNNRYLGRIVGSSTPFIIIGICIIFRIFIEGKTWLKTEYAKYALVMGIPLIPHIIGQYVLNQSDRIIITRLAGEHNSGLYSYAYSICTILLIVYQSIDAAWTPWVYVKIDKNEINAVKTSEKKYLAFGSVLFCGFVALAPDVYRIMANSSYWDGYVMILPLALSMFFLFLYYIPVNIEYYYKKTIYISLGTIIAATLNIVLNILFIPIYGYTVAAYTTLFSYMILFIMHLFIAMKMNLREFYLIKPILLNILIIVLVSLSYSLSFRVNSIFHDFLRYVLLILTITFCFYYFRLEIKKITNKIFRKSEDINE